MTSFNISNDMRNSCRVHAKLLDAFIEMTRQEIEKLPTGFEQESLREYLEALREDRKSYGSMAVPVVAANAA